MHAKSVITLADRGFTVKDAVGLYCAQVVAPPISTNTCTTKKIRRLVKGNIHVYHMHVE